MRKVLSFISAAFLCFAQPAFAQSFSSNHSGYQVAWDGTNPIIYASGCFTIPQIELGTTIDPTHQFNWNSQWVGLGANSLAQIGNQENISTASTFAQSYTGFFTTGAGGGGTITPGAYKPGDIICESVTCTLNCVHNSTTATVVGTQNDCPQTMTDAACLAATPGAPGASNWTFTQTLTNVHCDFALAEWITENSAVGPVGPLYPMAAFGYVAHRDATCEAPGSSGQCGGSSPVSPAFITSNQSILQNSTGNSYPSAPIGSGDGFNTCYSASATITCDNAAGLRNSGGNAGPGN